MDYTTIETGDAVVDGMLSNYLRNIKDELVLNALSIIMTVGFADLPKIPHWRQIPVEKRIEAFGHYKFLTEPQTESIKI